MGSSYTVHWAKINQNLGIINGACHRLTAGRMKQYTVCPAFVYIFLNQNPYRLLLEQCGFISNSVQCEMLISKECAIVWRGGGEVED